uniref:Orphan G-protein coupled receptor 12 n=1 Tax=Platynereis dumerilii TaxID=6359 RepID=A0A0K0PUS5_PLADU|nr:orphan G-protein coupled receptor 12 [Platynereis dumerilii]
MDFVNSTDDHVDFLDTPETGYSTTGQVPTTEEVWWSDSQIEQLSSDLWRYSAPVIFFLGVFGNLTTLVVLRWRRSASDTATTYFVQLVAAADLCVLVAGMLPQWMQLRNFADPMEDSAVGCKIYKFFMYSAGDVAVWFMAAFTVERFVAIYYPLKRSSICRISRIKLTAMSLVGVAIVKNVHVFVTRGAEWKLIETNSTYNSPPADNNTFTYGQNRGPKPEFYINENGERYELVSNCGYTTEEFKYFHLHVRVWLVFVLATAVPLVILIICNTAVIWKLLSRKKGKDTYGVNSKVSSSAEAAVQQITIMCLVISFSFFVFIIPTMILLVGKPHFKTTVTSTAKYKIARAVNNQLLYINHSINFYLYFLTCPSFREQTVALFLCKKPPQKLKSSNSGAGRLTSHRASNAAPPTTPDAQYRSLLSNHGTPV